MNLGAAARQEHPDSLPGLKALRVLMRESDDRPYVQPYDQLLGGLGLDFVLKHAGIEGVNVVYYQHLAHAFHLPALVPAVGASQKLKSHGALGSAKRLDCAGASVSTNALAADSDSRPKAFLM